jgi:predicted lipoprotein with Yx(FWY)xxD motif
MLKRTRRIGLCAAILASAAIPAAALASSSTVIGTGKVKRGTVLVTSKGLSLYGFTLDSKSASKCTSHCTNVWIPLAANGSVKVKAGSGLSQSKVGKVKRPNGSYQVTYNGHPLYRYVGDKKSGQENGEGKYQFSGYWYLIGKGGGFLWALIGGY